MTWKLGSLQGHGQNMYIRDQALWPFVESQIPADSEINKRQKMLEALNKTGSVTKASLCNSLVHFNCSAHSAFPLQVQELQHLFFYLALPTIPEPNSAFRWGSNLPALLPCHIYSIQFSWPDLYNGEYIHTLGDCLAEYPHMVSLWPWLSEPLSH